VGNQESREEEHFDYIIEIANEGEEYPALSYSPRRILPLNFNDTRHNNIIDMTTTVYNFINNCKDGKMLIHCGEGVSRSPSLLMLYLIYKYSITFDDAFTKVSAKRFIHPNVGFIRQLMNYSKTILS
jgi:predicted protein tyrosine phosphatase